MRIRNELTAIAPLDATEREHLADALGWVDSGAELFRVAKPATSPNDLVSYFAVVAIRNQNLCAPSGHLRHVADNVSTAVIARLRGGLRGTQRQVREQLDS